MAANDTYNTEGLLMDGKFQAPDRKFYGKDRDAETGEGLSWYNQGAEDWSGSDIEAALNEGHTFSVSKGKAWPGRTAHCPMASAS